MSSYHVLNVMIFVHSQISVKHKIVDLVVDYPSRLRILL